MTRRMVVLVAVATVAAAMSATARADTVSVGATGCALVQGGHASVPASSTVTIRMGFAEQSRGILQSWLNAETTTLTLDGGSVDVTGLFGAPEQRSDGSWVSTASYATGITLAAGQTLTFVVQTVLAHPVPEVLPGSAGPPAFNPAGTQPPLACTVTGV
jgi:hypothetical protein